MSPDWQPTRFPSRRWERQVEVASKQGSCHVPGRGHHFHKNRPDSQPDKALELGKILFISSCLRHRSACGEAMSKFCLVSQSKVLSGLSVKCIPIDEILLIAWRNIDIGAGNSLSE